MVYYILKNKEANGMPETILIVDDEKEIADLVELYLKNENYPIRKAYDAQTALGIQARLLTAYRPATFHRT